MGPRASALSIQRQAWDRAPMLFSFQRQAWDHVSAVIIQWRAWDDVPMLFPSSGRHKKPRGTAVSIQRQAWDFCASNISIHRQACDHVRGSFPFKTSRINNCHCSHRAAASKKLVTLQSPCQPCDTLLSHLPQAIALAAGRSHTHSSHVRLHLPRRVAIISQHWPEAEGRHPSPLPAA